MITIDALRICDGERTPLDGVTMLLTANAVHGIAGEGRSELLRAVYGLAVPESGSVTSADTPCGGATWPIWRRSRASGRD